MEMEEIGIVHVGERAFLKVGELSVEVKDYKISSSMHSGTELEVILPVKGEIMEFSMLDMKESPQNIAKVRSSVSLDGGQSLSKKFFGSAANP